MTKLATTSDESVRRLERKSLAEHIADELRDLVLLEKLAPGAPIPERETADALGVSRTPLRESLRILASEGLIEIAPNRPPRVANPSLDELKGLLQVQGSLEALAGELACDIATDAQLTEISRLADEMVEVSDQCDPLEFFQKDMKFHESIVAASQNHALIDTHKTYNSRLWRARFISSRRRVNRTGTLDQHHEIVEALLARQRRKCAKALRAHLEVGYKNIKTALSESSQSNTGKTS
ncbi:MAG: GntR family transcriptional regulator [Granulosicoccus sp.]